MDQGQMLRSLGNFIGRDRQGQNHARSQDEGLIRMTDVERPAIGREDAERHERSSTQQVEQVLRAHEPDNRTRVFQQSDNVTIDHSRSVGGCQIMRSHSPAQGSRHSLLELLDFPLELLQSFQNRRQVGLFIIRGFQIDLCLHSS